MHMGIAEPERNSLPAMIFRYIVNLMIYKRFVKLKI